MAGFTTSRKPEVYLIFFFFCFLLIGFDMQSSYIGSNNDSSH